MAYYAALVSTVQLLKEMSLSEHQDPNSLTEKQQVIPLYETLSQLQELLEYYSPYNDKEAAGFLDRIRDAACLAQDLIECQISDEACQARDIIESHVPNVFYWENFKTHLPYIPAAVQEVKSIIELQIAEKIHRPSCLEGIIHIVVLYLVSACHHPEYANKEAVFTLRGGYENLGKLTRELGSITQEGYKTLTQLVEVVCSITTGKERLDEVKLKEELDPIVINIYQELVKLKEELDAVLEKEYHDLHRAKKAVDSILNRGNQDLERVKEAIDLIVEKGCVYLMEKVNEAVDSIVGRGYQDLERVKEEMYSIVGRGYHGWERVKREVDSLAIKGYQDLMKLKKQLDATRKKGYQDLKCVNRRVFDLTVMRGYIDLQRLKEEVDFTVKKGYKVLFEKLKEEVDSIVEDLMRIKEKSLTTYQDDLQVSVGASTQGPSGGTGMVGFEEHLITIKNQLCGNSSKLEVISIVGMGGIGKSTLARNIFDDKLIDEHFDLRVWVTVSQSYHLRNILLAITNSLNINNGKLDEVEDGVLKELIWKCLFGKRYLIVMDDVWDLKIWDYVKWIFPDDDQSRSRIIATTRQSDVASLVSASDFINHIPVLEHDQSWDLFCEKVFCPSELEDIGRSIVKSCRGLPLAIVVVAGLLSKVSKTQYDWEEIARGVSSNAAKNEHFTNILSLSYDYLPHRLKPCFLYFGGFPEDYEISVSRLMKIWVAEGFLEPIASKSLEEVAEEYLDELVQRNLVLITKRKSNGKFKCCSIHDLLRNLCSERAYHEHFLLLPHKHVAKGHIHRFFIHPNSSSNIPMLEKDVLHVRSILSFGKTPSDFSSHPPNFKPLRVLDAPGIDLTFCIGEVFELLHLRYLVLLGREAQYISTSVFKLQNLQTLIVVSSGTIWLPPEFWKLPQLRHVMIPGGVEISGEVPMLGMLQTAYKVDGFKFNCETVEMIPNLKKLKLRSRSCNDNEDRWAEYGLKNLANLHQLEELGIHFLRRSDISFLEGYPWNAIRFPKDFSFPMNLKKLSLKGCHLPWEDMTIVGSLPNLHVLGLKLESFVGREWVPIEGEFPKLKFLLIDGLYDLECWGAENTHFPCLEQLHIRYCRKLEIPTEVGDIPTLQLIELLNCSLFVESHARKIQQEQEELGNNGLRVRCIRL